MQQEIFFSLSGIKTQKIKTQESKERKFEEKFRKKRVSKSNLFTWTITGSTSNK